MTNLIKKSIKRDGACVLSKFKADNHEKMSIVVVTECNDTELTAYNPNTNETHSIKISELESFDYVLGKKAKSYIANLPQ